MAYNILNKGEYDVKILLNGKTYTEDTRKPWAEAVAIEGKNFTEYCARLQ